MTDHAPTPTHLGEALAAYVTRRHTPAGRARAAADVADAIAQLDAAANAAGAAAAAAENARVTLAAVVADLTLCEECGRPRHTDDPGGACLCPFDPTEPIGEPTR